MYYESHNKELLLIDFLTDEEFFEEYLKAKFGSLQIYTLLCDVATTACTKIAGLGSNFH